MNWKIHHPHRPLILLGLVSAYVGLAVYFNLVLQTNIVYVHFAYLPVVLSCLWWGHRGMWLAGLLAAIVVGLRFFGIEQGALWGDAIRLSLLLGVGFVVAMLSEKVAARGRQLARSREKAAAQEAQLLHSTRLAELGEMAAAIAHELNQPLTGIRTYSKNAIYMIDEQAGNTEDVRQNLDLISRQVDRASQIILRMRQLARRGDAHSEPVNLNELIAESLEFLDPQLRQSGVSIQRQLDPDLPPIQGQRIPLEQVLMNLIANARQAMENSPQRLLVVRSRHLPKESLPVQIEVADSGTGFLAEDAERLFLPFHTTKPPGQGTGLGLSISRRIVEDHQGVISARPASGTGAVFTLRLPLAPTRNSGNAQEGEEHE